MNRIIAGIVALPLLVASMPSLASVQSVIVKPEVQKPQVGTLLLARRGRWIPGHWIRRNHRRVWIRGHYE